jgi:AraC-like DNA-binding protein
LLKEGALMFEHAIAPSSPGMGTRAPLKRRTVPTGAVLVLIEALQSIEGDVPGALRRAGLADVWPCIAGGRQADVSRISFARLAQECVMAFHYHACRRDALRPLPVDTFRLMCIALLACPTLHIALEVASAFQDMALGGRERLEVRTTAGQVTLTQHADVRGRQVGDMIVAMFGLAAHHRLFGWLTHVEIPLTRVTLAFAPMREQRAFNELFQLEPEFGHPGNSISFAAHFLDRPIVRSYGELASLFALFPFDLLPPDYDSQSLAERTRVAMSAALARRESPPTLGRLANMFGLTIATFRRRLAEERTSLIAIRAECRRTMAGRLLEETEMTVKEIAYRVQFGDVATFRRAFRGWTGCSPQAYRTTARAGSA